MIELKTKYYPFRLLMLVPVVMLSSYFEDPTVGMFFLVCASFVTSRMFPFVEFQQSEEEKSE